MVCTAEWAGWDGVCQVSPLWQNQPQTIGCLVLESKVQSIMLDGQFSMLVSTCLGWPICHRSKSKKAESATPVLIMDNKS